MIDSVDDGILGTAAKEMEEECGIKVKASELIDLTTLAYGSKSRGLAPSAGGSDEHIKYMYLERTVSSQQIAEMKGKLGGLRDHGEFITLQIIPFSDLWKCGDSKALW
jgi:ADP-sugar diphosphatase